MNSIYYDDVISNYTRVQSPGVTLTFYYLIGLWTDLKQNVLIACDSASFLPFNGRILHYWEPPVYNHTDKKKDRPNWSVMTDSHFIAFI